MLVFKTARMPGSAAAYNGRPAASWIKRPLAARAARKHPSAAPAEPFFTPGLRVDKRWDGASLAAAYTRPARARLAAFRLAMLGTGGKHGRSAVLAACWDVAAHRDHIEAAATRTGWSGQAEDRLDGVLYPAAARSGLKALAPKAIESHWRISAADGRPHLVEAIYRGAAIQFHAHPLSLLRAGHSGRHSGQ